MIKAIIADDEQLALARLRKMLEIFPHVHICGEATNGQDAVAAIVEHQPDILFLDIDMPLLDGFDVIDGFSVRLAAEQAPLVILVTAHPSMAARAFDMGVVDFLTKPIRLRRLETAIERARDTLASTEAVTRLADLKDLLAELRDTREKRGQAERWLWLSNGGVAARIDCTQVSHISAESEYIRLHLSDSSHLYRFSMTRFVEEHAELGFIRVHRSYAVQSKLCLTLVKQPWGGRMLELSNGVIVPIGRTYWKSVDSALQIRSSNRLGTE